MPSILPTILSSGHIHADNLQIRECSLVYQRKVIYSLKLSMFVAYFQKDERTITLLYS